MSVHELKSNIPFFNLVEAGLKRFELRKNDRNFQGGDILVLRQWDEAKQEYTGREFRVLVSLVFANYTGLDPDYCILSIVKD